MQNMIPGFRLTITTLVLGSSILSAQGLVLPTSAASSDPGFYNSYLLYGTTSTSVKNEARTQVLFSETELGSSVKIFKEMQVRRPHYISNQNLAMTGNMVLDLSSSTVAPGSATSTFASNHGTVTNVVTGQVSLPARNRGTAWPEPWETAIPFKNSIPYIYTPVKGGSFVVECAFSGNSSNQVWYVEATQRQVGTRVTNLNACTAHSDGGRNNSISHQNPQVGGSFLVYYNSMPSNVPSLSMSFMILGVGGGGTPSTYGGTLPVNLSTYMLPTTNCQLAVTDDIRLPLTYVTSTAGPNRGSLRSPTLQIPNNQALAGLSYFDQGICFDTNATSKQIELYTSWSSKWTIGSGLGAPMSTVYRTGDNTQTTGTFRDMEGPVLRFN